MELNKIHLTSSEIAALWTSYMNDSMAKAILSHMMAHIEDTEIKSIIQFSYDIAKNHVEFLIQLLTEEEYAIPIGFNEGDVNINSPQLFSETFCLTYVNHMAKVGLLGYSGMISMSARDDIREYFTNGLIETTSLYEKSLNVMLDKGIYIRAPYIETPSETDYINSKSYLSGLNPFTDKRPLNSIEISHLFTNIQTNSIGIKLCLAFAQTTSIKEIQDFMFRGKEISDKHVSIFRQTLLDDNITTPGSPDVCVTSSTTRVYSDKLMMFHMSLLSAAGTGNYATAASASQRSDLALNYERLSLEIGKYAKSGADIMIKYNWLEQPPGTKNRKKLAQKKED
ncbi:DUF3231 family protein [Niallia taxi]|uniref:DUF3231 family protein n=2 Tax=Bacillati TaxID=1783272 RepID=A0A3S2W102_9BACI|nr:DUF3231 family protein [Niallia taxi]RVT57205.1 DUF3231 family protein [Niallia taxi]